MKTAFSRLEPAKRLRLLSRFNLGAPRSAFGFTLVELLVTMAVLVMLVVASSQMVNSTAGVTTRDNQRLDASSEARMIFDRMETDFNAMFRRPDVDCTAYTYNNLASPDSSSSNDNSLFKRKGNDGIWFFAESDSYTSSNSSSGRYSTFAVVGYRIWEGGNTSSLSPLYSFERRGDRRVWDTSDSESGFVFLSFDNTGKAKPESTLRGQITSGVSRTGYAPTYAPIGPQTFRLEFCFLMKDKQPNGTYFLDSTGNIDPKKAFRDVSAIVVTIATLDARSRAKIGDPQMTPIKTLIDKLADGTTPDVAAKWNNTILTDPTIPRYIASNVRIFQRYIYLK